MAAITTNTTSRVGRLPITIPQGVEVKAEDRVVSAKGPKGQLSVTLHPYVVASVEDGLVKVNFNK